MADPTIQKTEYSNVEDRWFYLLSDGRVVKGNTGEARVPAGLPYTAVTQWAANVVMKARAQDG